MMETGIDPAASLTGCLNTMGSDKAVKMVRELCVQLSGDTDSFHGNIWPGNVRLDWEGKAVLGDGSDAPVSERAADQVEFLPPEFFWDNAGSAASDVYSLGLLLYAAANRGYMPFQPKGGALTDKDRSAALRKRMKGEPVPMPHAMSRQLKDILRKALAFEPENRYLSAHELLAALNETDEALPAAKAPETGAAELSTENTPVIGGAEAVEAAAGAETVETDRPDGDAPAEDAPAEDTPAGDAPVEDAPVESPVPENNDASEPEEEQPQSNEAETAPETMEPIEPDNAPDGDAGEIPTTDFTAIDALADDAETVAAETQPVTDGGEAAAEPGAEDAKAAPQPKSYTVQKDFDRSRRARKSAPAAPASRRRKRVSPLIPILCVLAVAIIGAAVLVPGLWDGIFSPADDSAEAPADTTSQPYIITPADTVDAAEADATPVPDSDSGDATDEPAEDETVSSVDDNTDEDAAPESADTDEATVTGSTTVDGLTVTAASDTVYVSGSGSNLRTGPGTTYGVAASLSRGVSLQRTGTVNSWSQVWYEGKEYYIATSLVTTTDPGTDSTTSTGTSTGSTSAGTGTGSTSTGTGSTSTSATVTATRDVVTVNADDSYLRSGPGTGYSHLYTLNSGVVLQRTGTVSGWSRVVYQGKTVYIHDSLISTVSSTTVTEAVGTLKASAAANIRSGAGTSYDVLGTVSAGTSLTITGLVDGKWYRVSYNSSTGYINRNMVSVSDFALVSTLSDKTLTVTSDANVRSGPSTDYSVLGVASTGTTLTVTGLTDSNWYRVSYGDSAATAYISASLVTVS